MMHQRDIVGIFSSLLTADELFVEVDGYAELASFLAAAAEGGAFNLQARELTKNSTIDHGENVKPTDIVGFYEGAFDGGNGSMRIKQRRNQFEVEVSVAAMGCTGGVAGVGELTANVLTISAREDDVECTITATFGSDLVEVREGDCGYFHGAACGFDGSLKKR